ncbi:MAG: TRAP transporter substrate-binding protein [Christensenellales bacterium]
MKKSIAVLLVLVLLGSMLVAFGSSAESPKQSRETPITIKIGTNHSSGTSVALSCQKFADLVAQKTGGGIKIDVFADGTLGSETELRDLVATGTIQMAALGAGVYGSYVPAANLPVSNFVFKDEEVMLKVLNGELGKKYINDPVEEVAGIHTLYGWPQAPRQLLTKKPVNSLADIKGMKIRVPAGNKLYTDTWNSYGSLAIALSMNEVYTALEQGVIDGLEMPIDSLYTAGYHEVAKHLTLTNHMMYVQYIMINANFWKTLSAEEQEAFNEAAVEAGEYHNNLRDKNIETMVSAMKDKGVTVVEIDNTEWIEATVPVNNQWMDNWGQEVYDAFTGAN